jgi:hypothetical protein
MGRVIPPEISGETAHFGLAAGNRGRAIRHQIRMRRLLVLGLVTAIGACGGVSGGGGPSTTTSSTPVGDQPIVEPGPPGSIPQPRLPIEGNVDGPVTILTAQLNILESFPIQVSLDVSGDRPTPCHEVFWTASDDGEVIEIDMISQTSQEQECTQVVEPFSVVVPLGSWADESREVRLNGEVVGSFEG